MTCSIVVAMVLFLAWLFREANLRYERMLRGWRYGEATEGREGTRARAGRNVERDVIELQGPPCAARVRFFHHTHGEGRRRRRIDYTEFLAEPRWREGAMRVSTPEWRGELTRFYGGRDLDMGDRAFDVRYVVESRPGRLAHRFLDRDTRARVRRLDEMGEGPFLLQVRPMQFLVRVSRPMRRDGGLGDFIADCFALVGRLLAEEGEEGSGGVEVQEVLSGAEADCQVCGARMEADRRVLCRRCRTPHHADCWAYNDGCSTFACGERRSVRG